MPTDPHTWDSDPITATILDGDFYLYGGQVFTPNGIRFHARKPIYKAYNAATSGNTTSNNNYCHAFGNSGDVNFESAVIVDTAGLVGAWFDPLTTGNIRLSGLFGGGGTPTSPAGLALFAGNVVWPSTSGSSNVACGFGLSSGSTASISGTYQATNSAHQTVPFCVDLVDSNLQRWALFGFNGSGGSLAPALTANADGSGWASRMHANWASVYPANGFTVTAAPAPFPNWLSSTTVTSAFLNGNTGLRDPLRYLNMPPLGRADASSSGSQALTANANTTVTMTPTSGYVTYNSMSGSGVFTAPFNGLYFVHGYVTCQNFSGTMRTGVKIAGTTYWGPQVPCPGSGEVTSTKTQIFSLNAGDTISLQALSTANSNTSTAHPARLVVIQVSGQGTPSPLPTAPDTSFRWTAGTPGPVNTLFNQHIANDLTLLTQRPYLMAFQGSSQTITPGTATGLTGLTIQGQVHSDAGDNYSGWNAGSSKYVAPVSGWYLCVEEVFLQAATLTSTPSVLALLGLSPSGTDAWDRYQQQNMITGGSSGSGATAISYYYLRAGDSITPGIETFDSSSTTIGTAAGTWNSHIELVWLGE